MAQEYWIKLTADGQEYGPYTGAQIRTYAAQGRVTPDSLITLDRATWHSARRIKGLFANLPAASASPAHAAVAAAPQAPARAIVDEQVYAPESAAVATAPEETAPEEAPAESEYELAPHAAIKRRAAAKPQEPAPSLGYYATPVGGDYMPLKRRSAIPFTLMAGLLFLSGVTVMLATFAGSTQHNVQMLLVALGACLAFIVLSIPTLILWLVWVGNVHKDLRHMTTGSYDISPGKAVGFSLIPIFDAYWVVYMPWRVSAEVNRHLRVRGLHRISATAVMICQIVSVAGAVFLPAITPLMYAVSMWQVQSGLNRLHASAAN